MRDKLIYAAILFLSGLVLVLAVSGIVLHGRNLAKQEELERRRQQVEAGQNFAQFYQGMVQNLASLAHEKSDLDIRALLESEGIKFTAPPVQTEDKSPRVKNNPGRNP